MKLSDSADSLLNVEFKAHSSGLDIQSFEKYLKAQYIKSNCTTYLIPISYSIYGMPCTPQVIKITSLYNYLKFEGRYISDDATFLEPIFTTSNVKR